MRLKEEEIRNIDAKRKKQKNCNYEEIKKSSHLAGYSFTVNNKTNRLNKWKQLLNIRYFQHLGTKDSFNVIYKTRGGHAVSIGHL